MTGLFTIPKDAWVPQNRVWPYPHCLYVIEEAESGFCKVGTAAHPLRRLSSLQSGNPRHLRLVGVYGGSREDCRLLEKYLLHKHRPSMLRGEWIGLPAATVMQVITGRSAA